MTPRIDEHHAAALDGGFEIVSGEFDCCAHERYNPFHSSPIPQPSKITHPVALATTGGHLRNRVREKCWW